MSSNPSERIKIPQGFWSGLRELGFSLPEIAQQAQLPTAIIEEPEGVATAQYYAIWQAYSELVGDISQAIIKLSTVFDTALYPPSMLATYHARDYRDALKRMAMYKQLCPPESLRMIEEGESCLIDLNWHSVQTGPAVLIGITLATLLELGRRGTGQPLQAKLVEFSNPMGDVSLLETYFGCQIKLGSECNRLMLHRRDLDRPFLSYNEELLEILTPALARSLDERQSNNSIIHAVKWIIKRCLAGSRPDMRSVARDLGMSERTLQRRLTEEGTGFKQLMTQVRHELALNYLEDSVLDMKEIAFLLGYEDQNSFYRAFRIWEGDTPSNWRIRHNHPSPTLAR
ncbi:AraC family transcriptional regulator [Paenibacillus glycanilyticus]|uniref:AraC family transcriptional regulator n=1 Tax=Paenibacillus glycanilyticus TaxID=126569 RepID=UPI00203ED4AC|nr:AraC family transcriptional regulator [Paenibacillus glycanilyticus]MCM3628391.1 AraC family transcriptional regulator [Paenibacillus glycanilyticus]